MSMSPGLLVYSCHAAEELIISAHYANGDVIPCILDFIDLSPRYVVILFPGGSG